jgi:hypothetical protein
MHVCMHACYVFSMYVCMQSKDDACDECWSSVASFVRAYIYVSMCACMWVGRYVGVTGVTYVCMHARMHACMYVHV